METRRLNEREKLRSPMRNFLIDTDTASDDAVAIIMALAEPSVRVLGLTTVAGNDRGDLRLRRARVCRRRQAD
jgi:purine nucleosidase